MHPSYTRNELIADACVHAIGITAGIAATAALLVLAGPKLSPLAITSIAIYGVTMVAMLVFSAGYNLIPVAAWKSMLRRCDQAAIFIKIAGTYTPFALAKMGGTWGYTLLALVWVIALLGGGAKLIFGEGYEGSQSRSTSHWAGSGSCFFSPLLRLSFAVVASAGPRRTGVHVWCRLPRLG